MQKSTEEKPKLQVRSSIEGLEVAPGTYRTTTGTICVPLSRQREEAKAKEVQEERKKEYAEKVAEIKQPTQQIQQVKHIPAKSVQFTTPIGTMEALYHPVIDTPNWIILGKTTHSFVPKSYKEDPQLKFHIKSDDLKETTVVFTGCEFTDPTTRSTYLIFMKV